MERNTQNNHRVAKNGEKKGDVCLELYILRGFGTFTVLEQ